jgi:hypothetical protein
MKPHLFLVLCTLPLHAGPQTSPSYTVTPNTMDAGGGRSISANYTVDGSMGLTGSTATGTDLVGKSGYAGQLYDVTSLTLAANPATLDEGGSRQLSATATLDDASLLVPNPSAVAWSVLTGPLSGISSAGLATAATSVYQDTTATVQGVLGGLTATLGLAVLDSAKDNYGSYAGDGIDDSWQFQYFGLGNPQAAPLVDPDGDGQNNHFEFTAGLVPNNPLSRLLLYIESVPGQPHHKNLIFEPIVPGRTYTVLSSTSLMSASWSALPGTPVTSDSGNQRTITDSSATEVKKFYRVAITKP